MTINILFTADCKYVTSIIFKVAAPETIFTIRKPQDVLLRNCSVMSYLFSMNQAKYKLEQLWDRQQIAAADFNYDLWYQKRASLIRMSAISRYCTFTVDVYRKVYDYASGEFESLFGIRSSTLKNINRQGDLFAT